MTCWELEELLGRRQIKRHYTDPDVKGSPISEIRRESARESRFLLFQ
jgi:hypothetical protein